MQYKIIPAEMNAGGMWLPPPHSTTQSVIDKAQCWSSEPLFLKNKPTDTHFNIYCVSSAGKTAVYNPKIADFVMTAVGLWITSLPVY